MGFRAKAYPFTLTDDVQSSTHKTAIAKRHLNHEEFQAVLDQQVSYSTMELIQVTIRAAKHLHNKTLQHQRVALSAVNDKGCTQWANIFVGFGGPRPLGARVVATPIFPQKVALKSENEK